MRIIDSHAHVFPFLGGCSGFANEREHLDTLQWAVRQHVQPVVRASDGSHVSQQTLVSEPCVGRSSLKNVSFRVGSHGRLEWTSDNEELYLQYMPPLLSDMTASPELLLALMDHAGVDTVVLHNDSIYGKLNEVFSRCAIQWPERFIALANVDVAPNNRDHQIAQLDQAIHELGHQGLFFKIDDFFMHDFQEDPFGDDYKPFWDHVESLGIPVYWQVTGVPTPTLENTFHIWERFVSWLPRYPELPIIIVGGLPWEFAGPNALPNFVRQALHDFPILVEWAFPIQKGSVFSYPFLECQEAAHFLLTEYGASRFVWGSDVPNIERYCSYRQSYEYLDHFNFLTDQDRQQILGGNLERLFRLNNQ